MSNEVPILNPCSREWTVSVDEGIRLTRLKKKGGPDVDVYRAASKDGTTNVQLTLDADRHDCSIGLGRSGPSSTWVLRLDQGIKVSKPQGSERVAKLQSPEGTNINAGKLQRPNATVDNEVGFLVTPQELLSELEEAKTDIISG